MYTIHVDVASSRRKRLHHILDHGDTAVWSGTDFAGALTYLYEIGETTFGVEGDEPGRDFVLQFKTE